MQQAGRLEALLSLAIPAFLLAFARRLLVLARLRRVSAVMQSMSCRVDVGEKFCPAVE